MVLWSKKSVMFCGLAFDTARVRFGV